jgi:hypothetical protein
MQAANRVELSMTRIGLEPLKTGDFSREYIPKHLRR